LNLDTDADGDAWEGDSQSIIRKYAFERGVLALPGTVFLPNGGTTTYVRASFSVIEEDKVDEALRRLRQAILDAREDNLRLQGDPIV
jgi:tryptophan aminotransferase